MNTFVNTVSNYAPYKYRCGHKCFLRADLLSQENLRKTGILNVLQPGGKKGLLNYK